jgi:hypothetical protein
LPVCVCQVVGEPSCGGIPIDELVEGQPTRQRTRPPDVAAELLAEPLDHALHEQALPGGQGALLPAGGAPCPDQDELQVPVRPAAHLDRRQVWVTSPVPNLQAGHCPHDSTNRNREYRQAACTMQAESSNTANPPAPRPDPACRIESKSIGVSSCAGEMTVLEAPGKIAFSARPCGGPPVNSSTRCRSGVPSGSSNTPSC